MRGEEEERGRGGGGGKKGGSWRCGSGNPGRKDLGRVE